MNAGDLIPLMLLILLAVAFATGTILFAFALRWARTHRLLQESLAAEHRWPRFARPPASPAAVDRPELWLAIRGRNLTAVQSALGLHHAKPCSWSQGLNEKLFISPPVHGWILVTGSALPDPADDVDACYRFVVDLSRRLGHVQFFSANRILLHHGWVQAEGGRVIRAYVWAERTLWKQGLKTAAERELKLVCYDYEDPGQAVPFDRMDAVATNVDRVPALAARWSLDPASMGDRFLERGRGIAGEPPRRFRV